MEKLLQSTDLLSGDLHTKIGKIYGNFGGKPDVKRANFKMGNALLRDDCNKVIIIKQ